MGSTCMSARKGRFVPAIYYSTHAVAVPPGDAPVCRLADPVPSRELPTGIHAVECIGTTNIGAMDAALENRGRTRLES